MKRMISSPLALAACGLLFFAQSCSRFTVKSDPPGATVLYSETGVEPWRQWPAGGLWVSGRKGITPMTAVGRSGEVVFVTVDKEGYRRPLPRSVQLYPMRGETMVFELEELPETIEARMRAEGMVYYEEEWVDPEERGLVEFAGVVMPREEAFRLEQRAKGLVEHNGQWMTPDEYRELYAREQQAAGLVLWKDRWVTPETARKEAQIEQQMLAIREEKVYSDLSIPRIGDQPNRQSAQVELQNISGARVTFLFSGPVSDSFVLDPYKSVGVRAGERILMPAGRYEIAIIAGPDPSDPPGTADRVYYGSWPLALGKQYVFAYSGREGDLREGLTEFEMPATERNFDVPEITIPDVRIPDEKQPQGPPGEERGGRRGGGGGRGGR